MDSASDAELIAASERQPDRFGLFFDRHIDRIYEYVRRRVGPSLAEELTAETFARAFEQRSRFVPLHEDARPWLYGIATNVIRNARRAERRQLAAYEKFAAFTPAPSDDFDQADARLDSSRAAVQLAAALRRIDRRERDALLLFVWAELKYDEIGTALGVPAGTVASRISRARRSLRTALRETGDDMAEEV
jgi:RNA polymerase sigma factor (sigma-70 family)